MSKRDNKKSTANMNIKAKRTAENNHKGGHRSQATSGSNGVKQKKTFSPHFRKYLKSNHPALIIGESIGDGNKSLYQYRTVTHSEREGRHPNEKVVPNPNPHDPNPMYIVKRVRKDEKRRFSKWKYAWIYKKNQEK